MRPVGGAQPAGTGVTSEQLKKAISGVFASVAEATNKLANDLRSEIVTARSAVSNLTQQVAQLTQRPGPAEKGMTEAEKMRLQNVEQEQTQQKQKVDSVSQKWEALIPKLEHLLTNLPPVTATQAGKPGQDPSVKFAQNLEWMREAIVTLSTNLSDLRSRIEKLPQTTATGTPASATIPTSLKAAVWLNLVLGLGVLAVSVVLLRDRKSVASQTETALKSQVSELGQALVSAFRPELEGVTRRVAELNGSLAENQEKQHAFLKAMQDQSAKLSEGVNKQVSEAIYNFKTVVEEQTKQFSNTLSDTTIQAAVQEAARAWQQQAEVMLRSLQAGAQQEFQKVFDLAKASWRSEVEAEGKQIKQAWEKVLEEQRSQWQIRLETEIAETKKAWITHFETHLGQWQNQVEGLEHSQTEVWRGHLDAAAKKAGEVWNSQLDELAAKTTRVWQQLEQRLSETQSRLEEVNLKLVMAYNQVKARDEALAALAWPPIFREEPLAGWRSRIEERLAQQDRRAFGLFLALGVFTNAARAEERDLRTVAATLHSVGTEAYLFWKAVGAKPLEAAQEWRAGFQNFLDATGLPMDIILALEGDRFDVNTMLSVESGSANRIYVKEALSWIVRDKSGQTPRVLCHARVVTC
ncbi:MAG: hypothetical protein AAB676_03415 [Verrucomicrobiota bacterium]